MKDGLLSPNSLSLRSGNLHLVCEPTVNGVEVSIRAESEAGPVLLATTAGGAGLLAIHEQDGHTRWVPLTELEAGEGEMRLWAVQEDLEVSVSFRAAESSGVPLFVQEMCLRWKGNETEVACLGSHFFLAGDPELFVLPSAQHFLLGDPHPCHAWRNQFLERVRQGAWNLRANLTAAPVLYHFWPGAAYAIACEAEYRLPGREALPVFPGLDRREISGRAAVGITFPNHEPEIIRFADVIPAGEAAGGYVESVLPAADAMSLFPAWNPNALPPGYPRDFAPGLTLRPGDTLRWRIFHFGAATESPHTYGSFLKGWYYLRGDHGDHVRWTDTATTLELCRDGFLHHYDPKHRILYDIVGYDGSVLHPTRGMSVGWTSGALAAFHMLRLGQHLEDEGLVQAAQSVLENIASSLTPGGFYSSEYDEQAGRWSAGLTWWDTAMRQAAQEAGFEEECYPSGAVAGTMVSEATFYMLRAAQLLGGSRLGERCLETGLSNLQALCRVAPDGVLGSYYDPETGEIVRHRTLLNNPAAFSMDWVAALCLGFRLSGRDEFLDLARKAGRYYRDRFLSRVHLPGDPCCDACAPMAESSYHALRGYWRLFETTGTKEWLDDAIAAAHNVFMFRFAYNVRTPKGSEFERLGFRGIGLDHHGTASHQYGAGTASYLLKLWIETQDPYFLHRAVDTVRCTPQFLSRYDGDLGGKRGMLTEALDHFTGTFARWSHMAPIAWVTHACLCTIEEFGGILVDWRNRIADSLTVADIEKVRPTSKGLHVQVANPWPRHVETKLAVYFAPAEIRVRIDGQEAEARPSGGSVCALFRIPAYSAIGIEVE